MLKAHIPIVQDKLVLTKRLNFRRRIHRRKGVITMVLTESADLPAGTDAPDFTLPEPKTGKNVSLADVRGSAATLIMIICNHCPYVVMLKDEIVRVAQDYQSKGVGVAAISSNSVQTHPQDGPEKMAAEATRYPFSYLYDETQEVAKAYKAVCTPEFYVFDSDLKLKYHGQFDDARPSNGKKVDGHSLRAALDATLAGKVVPSAPPSIGCNVKWHPGKAPAYH